MDQPVKNNLIKQSHRSTRRQERQQWGFRSRQRAQGFLDLHARVSNLHHPCFPATFSPTRNLQDVAAGRARRRPEVRPPTCSGLLCFFEVDNSPQPHVLMDTLHHKHLARPLAAHCRQETIQVTASCDRGSPFRELRPLCRWSAWHADVSPPRIDLCLQNDVPVKELSTQSAGMAAS